MPNTTVTAPEDSSRVEILSEPLTYDRHAPQSYFRDLALSQLGGDLTAEARLERHGREMRVELPKLEARARRVNVAAGVEFRTSPNTVTSTLSPPLWAISDFATLPRPKRILANLVRQFPLPAGVHSVNLPRFTTGTTEAPATDLSVVPGSDIVDTSSQSIVTTLSGQADTSLQLLEQSPPGAYLDEDLFRDMTEAFDAQVETQLINGSGTGENLLGVLNASTLPTANKVAYTDASPTGPEFLVPFAEAFAAVGDSRDLPPECFMMRTARWAWFATQTSTGGNPLFLADWGPEGQGILSLRTYWNDAIPATLGAGGNQDAILCVRPSDIMLWEGDHRTAVMQEPLSGTLGVRFQLHGSVAAIIRYPAGQATITGTGMVVQANY